MVIRNCSFSLTACVSRSRWTPACSTSSLPDLLRKMRRSVCALCHGSTSPRRRVGSINPCGQFGFVYVQSVLWKEKHSYDVLAHSDTHNRWCVSFAFDSNMLTTCPVLLHAEQLSYFPCSWNNYCYRKVGSSVFHWHLHQRYSTAFLTQRSSWSFLRGRTHPWLLDIGITTRRFSTQNLCKILSSTVRSIPKYGGWSNHKIGVIRYRSPFVQPVLMCSKLTFKHYWYAPKRARY